MQGPPPPPPALPELPEGAEPRWPAWYAAASFAVGLIGTLVAVGIIAVATGTDSGEDSSTLTILGTLAQSLIFIGTAVLFASMTAKPRPWHFGLRPTRFWPAVGWAALAVVLFFAFTILYTALLQPDIEQDVTEQLGADEGDLGLIVAGLMVVIVAPVGEEIFFRGFFYKALRSRFSFFGAAAIDGLVFGAIHWNFEDAENLLIVPVLGVLGFLWCLVYERTGSIYPVIALHAINNALAYGSQVDAWEVSAVLGPLMIAACVLAPRLIGGPPARHTTETHGIVGGA